MAGWSIAISAAASAKGLDKNIISAYYWLATRYQPGDKIWLFGFSRGAYTVRSLGGMISRCGLLNASQAGTGDDKVWEDINDLFSDYRQPAGSAPAIVASVGRPFYSVATGASDQGEHPYIFYWRLGNGGGRWVFPTIWR
ncbi:Uncharacterized conserved protein [Raoultella planticola]|uniref:Uncharacterized conserved protein n=1 Tax=Raoultella planticola TaxID=575 RepID=A0A485D635_RAOPL|nr:Uncharacterized conserved protein [Raoultella planticola]